MEQRRACARSKRATATAAGRNVALRDRENARGNGMSEEGKAPTILCVLSSVRVVPVSVILSLSNFRLR